MRRPACAARPARPDDPPVLRDAGVALGHSALHFDCATHGVDYAAEFHNKPVARALDDAPVVDGYRRVDQIAAKGPEPREGAVLVGAGEPAVACDIGGEDRREFPVPAMARPRAPRKCGL